MDFNATIDLIIKDLEEASRIIDDLKRYQGVPVLQVELAKAKCKSASQVIGLLKTIEIRDPANDKTKTVKTVPEQIHAIEPDSKMEKDTVPVAIRKKYTPDVSKKDPASHIIGDSFSHLSKGLNEQLGSRISEDDRSDIILSKPLSSLKEAIGVNDRFLFIREIFDGNKEAYSQAITRLDNAESINDARAVIMSYTGDNKENEAVKQLLDLVKRKLPSHE